MGNLFSAYPSPDSWPLTIKSYSSGHKSFCREGISYSIHQKINHTKPNDPVIQKTSCQPWFLNIKGTISKANTTPTLVPELKMPVAKPLSLLGNHSATAFMAAGKLPASPTPNPTRATEKPKTLRATACNIPAALQITMEIEYPSLVPTLSTNHPKNNKPIA